MYFSINMHMNTNDTYTEQHRKPEEQQYCKDTATCFVFELRKKLKLPIAYEIQLRKPNLSVYEQTRQIIIIHTSHCINNNLIFFEGKIPHH